MCGSTWTKVRLLCQSSSPLMPIGQDFKWVTAASSFLIAMFTAPTKWYNCLLHILKSCLQFHHVLSNICDFFIDIMGWYWTSIKDSSKVPQCMAALWIYSWILSDFFWRTLFWKSWVPLKTRWGYNSYNNIFLLIMIDLLFVMLDLFNNRSRNGSYNL